MTGVALRLEMVGDAAVGLGRQRSVVVQAWTLNSSAEDCFTGNMAEGPLVCSAPRIAPDGEQARLAVFLLFSSPTRSP